MHCGPSWETWPAQDEVRGWWCVECNALRNPVQQLCEPEVDGYYSGVQDETSRLGPLRRDVPAARRELAEALRAQFLRLEISVRGYAGKQARSPSSITRYLNATILPPQDFIDDLTHDVAQRLGVSSPAEPLRLNELYRAAQDAQPGGWGHTNRLKREVAKGKERARAVELNMRTMAEEYRLMQRQLQETQAMLDQLRRGSQDGHQEWALEHYRSEREFLLMEEQRSKTELDASRLLLKAAENRIAELERECASLRPRLRGTAGPPVPALVGAEWRPWYRPQEQGQHTYWRAYSQLLAAKGWSPAAIASTDAATDQVIGRLANPATRQAYQAKGMVIGYPQSGKTANITGLVAKAVDVGYRLVIVLSGPRNVLRQHLQQRLDEELPSIPDTSGIVRLTTHEMDYHRLAQRLGTLEFEKRLPEFPLNDPRNLQSASVRLMVVKKNQAVLTKLINDLQAIRTPTGEIPALVIDADDWLSRGGERISKSVSTLLAILPRAQYVSYTTSSIMDAFLDPADSKDLFPRDFIVSLPRPEGYLGARDFHDLDAAVPPEQRDFAASREKSYVRHVDSDDAGLREAMDMFVLTAAMKVHRESTDGGRFPRHTMVVEELSRRIEAQDATRTRLDVLWKSGAYSGSNGRKRLCALFATDVLPVSRVRGKGHAVPASFAELLPSLDEALARIGDHPAAMETRFDQGRGWKILVSGPATDGDFCEGLTVSYLQGSVRDFSTLPMLGRWFGFRTGYHDLVRLYFSRPADTAGDTDFYAAFVSFCRHEEELREELHAHQGLTPAQVPPLIASKYAEIRGVRAVHDVGPGD